MIAVGDDVFYLLGDMVDVVASDASDRFYLILDGGIGVLLCVFELQVDLIIKLIVGIGFAQDVEFVGSCLFEDCKFVQVDVGEGGELVILDAQMFNFRHAKVIMIIRLLCKKSY